MPLAAALSLGWPPSPAPRGDTGGQRCRHLDDSLPVTAPTRVCDGLVRWGHRRWWSTLAAARGSGAAARRPLFAAASRTPCNPVLFPTTPSSTLSHCSWPRRAARAASMRPRPPPPAERFAVCCAHSWAPPRAWTALPPRRLVHTSWSLAGGTSGATAARSLVDCRAVHVVSALNGLWHLRPRAAVGSDGWGRQRRPPTLCTWCPVWHLQSLVSLGGRSSRHLPCRAALHPTRMAPLPLLPPLARMAAAPALSPVSDPLARSQSPLLPPSFPPPPSKRRVERPRHERLPPPHRRRARFRRCHSRLPAPLLIPAGGSKAFAPPTKEATVQALGKRVCRRDGGGRRLRRPPAGGSAAPRAGRPGRGRGGVPPGG